ncbi:MAG TPA: hypothetical protein VFR66_02490 [Burkholderiales bacterium]|nr:hypothetical protein [Burkholderiales bacterium]
MQLIEQLEDLASRELSLFRSQLLREDVARLSKLQELARTAKDLEAFKKSGMRIGWTQGDARTHELREPLERLLAAVYAFEKNAAPEAPIVEAWEALYRSRMEKLVGCLSTPVPKPVD